VESPRRSPQRDTLNLVEIKTRKILDPEEQNTRETPNLEESSI
jgi:hypothetical protein